MEKKYRDSITITEVNKSFGFTTAASTCNFDVKGPIESFDISINGAPHQTFINPRVLPTGTFQVNTNGTMVVSNILIRVDYPNGEVKREILSSQTFYIIDDRPQVSVPSYDPSNVRITLAGLCEGEISKKRLAEDPVLRLSNNANNSFILKGYTVSTKINGKSTQNYYQGDSLFPVQEIKGLGSVKRRTEAILFIQNVILLDMKDREHKIPGIAFRIIQD